MHAAVCDMQWRVLHSLLCVCLYLNDVAEFRYVCVWVFFILQTMSLTPEMHSTRICLVASFVNVWCRPIGATVYVIFVCGIPENCANNSRGTGGSSKRTRIDNTYKKDIRKSTHDVISIIRIIIYRHDR